MGPRQIWPSYSIGSPPDHPLCLPARGRPGKSGILYQKYTTGTAGTQLWGPPRPQASVFTGATRPRTPGVHCSRACPARTQILVGGATRPRTPGYFLLVQKVPKNTPRPRSWNPLSNRILVGLDSTLPLNQQILRVSNLRRVSRPPSPDGLLKGQMNLFVPLDQKCPASRGPTGGASGPPDRLRGTSRNAASQWLHSAPSLASD